MKPLSVIFVGTGTFGRAILENLSHNLRFKIPFVITGLDKPKGRYLEFSASSIKQIAIQNKLIVQQPQKIKELKQKLILEKPDFLLVIAYAELIDEEILKIPKMGSINIHASLLPKYRGASPIQEAILRGDTKTGVTWILMNKKMDQGDIIDQKSTPLATADTYETLSDKLEILAADYTPSVLKNFSQTKKLSPQDETKASYCRKIKKDDGYINVNQETAEEIIRKIRAYTLWPGCFLYWNNKRLKIIQAAIGEQKISSGETAALNKNQLVIGTLKKALLPLIVQPEAKRKMTIEEFLRGQKTIPKKLE